MPPDTAPLSSTRPSTGNRKFLISGLNGTAIYVLAYYIVWGLHQGAKLEASLFYNLRGTWDPSRILYSVANDEWGRRAMVAAYGSGPAVCLLVGLAAYRWYWKRGRAQRGQLKLLVIWVGFHSCNAAFGALLADVFTHDGFWRFGLGTAVNALLALAAGLAQLVLGYLGALAFLQAHDSHSVMKLQNRRRMVAFTLLLPWVVGGACIALAKLPYLSMPEGLHLLLMALLVGPLAWGCLTEPYADTVKRPKPTQVAWGLVAMAVVVAVVWYLVLSPPVAFG